MQLWSQVQVAAIGFWNVENLFDTIDDRYKRDNEFTPNGTLNWTAQRYAVKLDHLAKVISMAGLEATPHGLSVLGMCEVENKRVLQDLVTHPAIKQRNYQFILIDGPDIRGIDPCFIYNPKYLEIRHASAHRVKLADSSYKTRDVLLVTGKFCGEDMAFIVNHWPSRRGGELASRKNRVAAAIVVRRLCDSITRVQPTCKVLIMGDLNDDPHSYTVSRILKATGKMGGGKDLLFNAMDGLFRKGIGTLAWSDSWNLFDQVILSPNWLQDAGWQYRQSFVFNREFLINDKGNFRGYPFRTYSGGIYTAGYSDHFLSYITISRKNVSK